MWKKKMENQQQQQQSKAVATATKQQQEQEADAQNEKEKEQKSNHHSISLDPATATDPKTHVDFLLSLHTSLPKLEHKETSGGVLPVCQDPITKEIYILLGQAKKSKVWNNFYGFIDGGETMEQGSAREGWEEGKGSFGDLLTLWRAVMMKGIFSLIVGNPNRNIHLINIGELNFVERSQFISDFYRNTGWSHASREVRSVKFFEVKTLKHICLAAGAKQKSARASASASASASACEPSPSSSSSRPPPPPQIVININEETGEKEIMRAGLAQGMSNPLFWKHDLFERICNNNNNNVDLKELVLPLSALPPLEPSMAAILPFKRASRR